MRFHAPRRVCLKLPNNPVKAPFAVFLSPGIEIYGFPNRVTPRAPPVIGAFHSLPDKFERRGGGGTRLPHRTLASKAFIPRTIRSPTIYRGFRRILCISRFEAKFSGEKAISNEEPTKTEG